MWRLAIFQTVEEEPVAPNPEKRRHRTSLLTQGLIVPGDRFLMGWLTTGAEPRATATR